MVNNGLCEISIDTLPVNISQALDISKNSNKTALCVFWIDSQKYTLYICGQQFIGIVGGICSSSC